MLDGEVSEYHSSPQQSLLAKPASLIASLPLSLHSSSTRLTQLSHTAASVLRPT